MLHFRKLIQNLFFLFFFLLSSFFAKAQFMCAGDCCTAFVEDFEGFSFGGLGGAPGPWIAEYGMPNINDISCSGDKALSIPENSGVNFNEQFGIAPRDIFEQGKEYCISFCVRNTGDDNGDLLLRAVNAQQSSGSCSGDCVVIGSEFVAFGMTNCAQFTFTPTKNYESLILSVPDPMSGIPLSMAVDEFCIKEVIQCEAAFSYEIQDCGKVQFTNESVGSNLTFEWDIDGMIYTEENPCVNFSTSDFHNVSLTISDGGDCEDTFIENIDVFFDDFPPLLDCSDDYTVTIPFGQNCEDSILLPEIIVDDDDLFPVIRCFFDGDLVADPSQRIFIPPGTFDVFYEVTDECGNQSTCEYVIEVLCETNPCDSIMVMIDTLAGQICYDSSVITGFPCLAVDDPVCGCDGVEYSNSCYAQEAGVPSWTPGNCVPTPDNQNCWYALDLDLKGVNLAGVEVEILTPGVIFNTAVVKHNLNLMDNITSKKITVSGVGWSGIPAGSYDNFLNFCFGNVDSAAQNPQCVVIRHLQRNPLDIPEVICTDTLKFYCEPPTTGDTCVQLKEETVTCDLNDPTKFILDFKVENKSNSPGFQPNQVILNSTDPTINFRPCGAPPIILPTASLAVNLSPPLAPSTISGPLCAEIISTVPITAPTQFCFSMTIWDADECCTSTEESCVILEPCCDPCEDRGFVVKPSSGKSGSSGSGGSTISLQASKDGTIIYTQFSYSDGTSQTLESGAAVAGSESVGYELFVDFDLQSVLPCPTAVLTGATLEFSADPNTSGHANSNPGFPCYDLLRVTSPWAEATLYTDAPTSTLAGKIGFPDPMTSLPYDSRSVNVLGLVQDMFSNPSTSHGFRLMTTCAVDQWFRFASREHPMQNLRPKLILTFDDSTCPPVDTFCCHTVDLINDCNRDLFTKVSLKSITPGVKFSSHYTGGTNPLDWSNPVTTSTCIEWEHTSGFIPTGTTSDMINFCLDSLPAGIDSQSVVLNWFMKDLSGNDSIACADTMKFYCKTDYPCVDIIDVGLKDFECEDCCEQPLCSQWLRDTITRSQNSGCNPIVDYYKFEKAFWNGQCVLIGSVSGAPDGGGEDIFDCQGNLIQSCRAAIGIQCNPNAGINISTDLVGLTNIWNCGDVLPPIGPGCNASTQFYNYDITFKNSSNHFADQLFINQIAGPSISVSPSPVNISGGMNPCDIETVNLTLFGGLARAGDQVKFEVRLHDSTSPDDWCCFEGDTLCVTLPPCDTIDQCCDDFDEFCDKVDQGWQITQNGCDVTVTAPQFDSCHWFGTNGPDWGDGGFTLPQIIPATGTWTHTYPQNGTYNICITVYEGNDVDDFCWNKQMCTEVTVECDTVSCDSLDWSGFDLMTDTLCINGTGNLPDVQITPVFSSVTPDWIDIDLDCNNSVDFPNNTGSPVIWSGITNQNLSVCATAYKIINGDTCDYSFRKDFMIDICSSIPPPDSTCVPDCCLAFNGITSVNPFNLTLTSSLEGSDFIDVDNDGDFDYVTDGASLGLVYYENIGTSTAPAFGSSPITMLLDAWNPYGLDYNGDGFTDIFARDYTTNELLYYQNMGLSGANFTLHRLGLILPSFHVSIAVGDIGNDGIADLLISEGSSNLKIVYYEGQCSSPAIPCFSLVANSVAIPLIDVPGASVTSINQIELFDGDCDGDLDIFMANGNGASSNPASEEIWFLENHGTVTPSGSAPDIDKTTHIVNSSGLTGWIPTFEDPTLRFVDIDNDGKAEAFIESGADGDMYFYENCENSPPVTCCDDFDEFCDFVDLGWTVSIDSCVVTVTAPQFDTCCYWFGTDGPDWGDGSITLPVVTPTTGTWTHTYAQPGGTFNICVQVYEGLPGSTTSCWDKQMCTSVTVLCDSTILTTPCDSLDWSGFDFVTDTLCVNGGGNAPNILITPIIGTTVPDWIEYDFDCDNTADRTGNSTQQFTWTGLTPGTYSLCAKAYKIVNGDTCSTSLAKVITVVPCPDDVNPCDTLDWSGFGLTIDTFCINGASNLPDLQITPTNGSVLPDWIEYDFNCDNSIDQTGGAGVPINWGSIPSGNLTLCAKAYKIINGDTCSTSINLPISVVPCPDDSTDCGTIDWTGFDVMTDTLCVNGGGNAPDILITPIIGTTVPDWIEYDFDCDNTADRTGTSTQQFTWTGLFPGTYSLCAKAYKVVNGDTCSTSLAKVITVVPCPDDVNPCDTLNWSGFALSSDTICTTPGALPDIRITPTNGSVVPDWIEYDFNCDNTIDQTDSSSTPIFWNNPTQTNLSVCATAYKIINGDTCTTTARLDFIIAPCPGDPTDPCDDAWVTYVPDNSVTDSCCWLVTIDNNYRPNYFKGITMTPTAPVSFSQVNSRSGWTISQFNTGLVTLLPSGGSIPMGASLTARICIADYSTAPQIVELDWLVDNAGVCDTVCSDTLLFNCTPPAPPSNDCIQIVSDSIDCATNNYCFKIRNNTSPAFDIESVVLNNLTPTGASVSSNPISIPLLAPGATSDWICVQYSGAVGGDDLCFQVIGHKEDINTIPVPTWCCSDTMQHCVTIPSCPCENVQISSISTSSGDSCCYAINVVNNFNATTFIGIKAEVTTPGVYFANIAAASTDWGLIYQAADEYIFDYKNSGGFIPVGTAMPGNYCLTGYTTASQQVKFSVLELDQMTGDTIETCMFFENSTCSPPPPDLPCTVLFNDSVYCENNGDYVIEFQIKNNTHLAPLAPGYDFLSYSLSNFVTSGSGTLSSYHYSLSGNTPFPLMPSQSTTSPIQHIVTGGMPGDTVCFSVTGHDKDVGDIFTNCCTSDSIWCFILPPNDGCILDPQGVCCVDSLAFLDSVALGWEVVIDSCFVTVRAPQFDSCHWFTSDGPIWGDGPVNFADTTRTNGTWSHQYDQPGTYDICINVFEGDSLGNACWEAEMCTSVTVDCPVIPSGNCDSLQLVRTAGDDIECCFAYSIDNPMGEEFDRIDLRIITPNVYFASREVGGANPSDWEVNNFSNQHIQFEYLQGDVSSGNHPDIINFCLDKIFDQSQIPQIIVIEYLSGNFLVCNDTLTLSCVPPIDYECIGLESYTIDCNDDGSFDFNYTINNISTDARSADRLAILLKSPSSASLSSTGSLLSPALQPGEQFSGTITISGVALGDTVVIEMWLEDLLTGTSWGCFENSTFSIPLVNCATACNSANIRIPNGLTPDNGDNINQNLVIAGRHPECGRVDISIYNRWGQLVFSQRDYDDTWQGYGTENEALPDGTYYLILEYPDQVDRPSIHSWLDLRRE